MASPKEGQRRQVVTWQEFEDACNLLAASISKTLCGPQYIVGSRHKRIVGVVRGGLIPAVILSHWLEVPMASGPHVGSDLIVVDDVCDTGETFRRMRQAYPGAMLVAPYVKPAGRSVCDLSAVEVEQDVWLRFPWEVE